ncbi:alpha/beta family hydrolase [Nostocoides vanveenii]|uniref:KANL3/Tex30 alpha/beta hydrolase-like domain-containing protein n=1 Tax=Nostocoides vanveenii TaxID=330835 RepID=A0ABN2KQW0_9MICO
MPEARQIETPGGPGRAFTYAASGPDPLATVVLGHGAGGGLGASDLVLLARALPERGYRVILIEQPWKVAGRKIAGRPPTLDAAWVPMIAALGIVGPLAVGGRSAGARVACRTAAEVGASGVLCLSFPLHPPGKPEASRAGELRAPGDHGLPVRVVQGERDPFGGPDEVRAELADPSWVAGVPGTHSFGRTPTEVLAATLTFLPALTT